MSRRIVILLMFIFPCLALAEVPDLRLFKAEKKPGDRRLIRVRTLDDKDFLFTPPATLAEWQARREVVRQQILVANGLWPMPPAAPLKPTIHGRIDRDGYSVEKVFFASHPGHYVSGNLYRPRTKTGDLPTGKLPAVLCPHGHWANGRFYDAGEAGGKAQIARKAEKTIEGARYPLQARCAQLARMGCVVFFYDMVGYADSNALPHNTFADVESELYLLNLMGVQTFNSLRALDFLVSLPEVDGKRIAVTGASGGGTQTFILGAIDQRPAVAFPAVMVSTEMQGGCVCENAPYLRIGTGNVEFASLFAPKPLAMSAARDWTLNVEREGLPPMKALWKMFEEPDRVAARCWPEFGHNYNQPAREFMYNWFNQYLDLKQPTPVVERPFVPIPPRDLSVYDTQHPRPADSLDAAKLRAYLVGVARKQATEILPRAEADLPGYRDRAGVALRVMLGSNLPESKDVQVLPRKLPDWEGLKMDGLVLGRNKDEQVPAIWVRGKNFNGQVVVWIDPAGKVSLIKEGKLLPEAKQILDGGASILAVDVFGTGELALEKPPEINSRFSGYTFGYNRPLLSQRAHDVLTAVAAARKLEGATKVHLYGRGKAGPWVLLARGLCGAAVTRTAADLNRFRFDAVKEMTDENMLPGALRYGGLPGLAGLAAPAELLLWNHQGTGSGETLKSVYRAAGAESHLTRVKDEIPASKVVEWLLR